MGVEVIHASACQYTAVRYFCKGGTDAPVQQLLPRLVLVLTLEPAAAYGFKEPPAKTFPERPHDPNGTISIDHIPRWRVAHRTSATSADSRPSASHASSRGTAGHALRRVPGRGHWCGVSAVRGWNSTSTSMPGAGICPSCESGARRRCPALAFAAGCAVGMPVWPSNGDDPVDRPANRIVRVRMIALAARFPLASVHHSPPLAGEACPTPRLSKVPGPGHRSPLGPSSWCDGPLVWTLSGIHPPMFGPQDLMHALAAILMHVAKGFPCSPKSALRKLTIICRATER